jgi:hypothetical protein
MSFLDELRIGVENWYSFKLREWEYRIRASIPEL